MSVRVKSAICTEAAGVSSLSCFSVQRRLLWAGGRLLGQVSSRCHHEERGKAEEEGGELGCPGPGVYTDTQKEREEA